MKRFSGGKVWISKVCIWSGDQPWQIFIAGCWFLGFYYWYRFDGFYIILFRIEISNYWFQIGFWWLSWLRDTIMQFDAWKLKWFWCNLLLFSRNINKVLRFLVGWWISFDRLQQVWHFRLKDTTFQAIPRTILSGRFLGWIIIISPVIRYDLYLLRSQTRFRWIWNLIQFIFNIWLTIMW